MRFQLKESGEVENWEFEKKQIYPFRLDFILHDTKIINLKSLFHLYNSKGDFHYRVRIE